jgi:hypothetical protein
MVDTILAVAKSFVSMQDSFRKADVERRKQIADYFRSISGCRHLDLAQPGTGALALNGDKGFSFGVFVLSNPSVCPNRGLWPDKCVSHNSKPRNLGQPLTTGIGHELHAVNFCGADWTMRVDFRYRFWHPIICFLCEVRRSMSQKGRFKLRNGPEKTAQPSVKTAWLLTRS